MAYIALYRRWRPQDFDALVGQQPVKTALSNALASGRIAHAYLFAGPRGTGKTSTARILAKALNCDTGPTAHPCGHCVNCERIAEGSSMDVLEIDAASNRGIEEIKTLREQLAFTPVSGRYKVYIIDEVHMLTTEAFNALLKTLEEPPAHVVFILATTDPHKIPATIHSRCQRFDFRRVTVEEIAEHLAKIAAASGIEADSDALRLIAVQAEGGLRDALSLLDQCGVMAEKVTLATVRGVLGIVGREALRELVAAIGQKQAPETLAQFNALLEQGKDARQVLAELAEYFRALLLYQAAPEYQETYLTDTAEALNANAVFFSCDRLMAAEERLHTALGEIRQAARPRIAAELCLFDLCRVEGSTLAALAARVRELEDMLAAAGEIKPDVRAAVRISQSPQHETPPAVERQKNVAAADSSQYENEEETAREVQSVAEDEKADTAGETALEGDTVAGEEYWRKAVELLAAENKRAMASCAKSGRVTAFVNGQLEVTFSISFQCERMNKDDYRQAFEDALLRVARQSIRLKCVTAGKNSPTAAQTKKVLQTALQKTPPDKTVAKAPPEVLKAAEVFGGTLHTL